MKKYLSAMLIAISYFCFWIFLNERLTTEVFAFGGIVSIAIYIINKSVTSNRYIRSFKHLIYYIKYLGMLMKEIVVANINVALILISPRINIKPCLVKYKTKLKSNLNRVILANSITLTPGTVTVTLEEDEIIIHCLSEAYISGVVDSKLEDLLLKVEE